MFNPYVVEVSAEGVTPKVAESVNCSVCEHASGRVGVEDLVASYVNYSAGVPSCESEPADGYDDSYTL